MRKLIIAIIGLVLIALSVYVAQLLAKSNNKKRPEAPKVNKVVFTKKVTNSDIPVVIAANGVLNAKRNIEIFSEVAGIFKPGSKLFKTGQAYRKGQVLITIDNTEFKASLQAAKSNFHSLLASIMPDLRLDFPEAFKKWNSYLNNFSTNTPIGALPKTTSDKENYFMIGRGINSAYFNIKNLENRLSKYKITAPFNGILTESLVTEGTLIRNNQKLGEFIDNSAYEMQVNISKSYINFISIGDEVNLQNLEHTKHYKGKVSRINASVDAATQSVSVFIDLTDKTLKEGIYLEAKLNTKKIKNAIEINRNLLLDNNNVFIVRDSVLDKLPVTPVYFSDTKMIIKGLPNGTSILSKPLQGAFAGMIVKVFDANNTKDTK